MMKDRKNFLMRSSRDSYSNHADYIFSIKHQNAFFTHIAPIIFKKDLWEHFYSEEMVKKHQASFSIHVYLFLSILKMASKIGFYPEQILALRVGYPLPEWLTEDGRYDRIRMDVINFTDMVRDVFHEESIIRHFKDIMLKKSVFILIAGSKIRCSFPTRFYIRLLTFLFAHYKTHPFFWYAICPALLIPRIAVLLPYRWFVQKSK
jgi:predicted SAM-dependent methyltransferase